MINLVATTRCFCLIYQIVPHSLLNFVVIDLQQVQSTRRSLHRLPVASSRDVKGGNLWLGWTYQVLGLNERSWKKKKKSRKRMIFLLLTDIWQKLRSRLLCSGFAKYIFNFFADMMLTGTISLH